MKKFSRLFLIGSLVLILLTAACGANQTAVPTLINTLPALETSTPAGAETTTTAETATTETPATATLTGSETATLSGTQSVSTQVTSDVGSPAAGTSQTPGIPVTGADINLVDCQFCIDNMAHALLVLPDTATFQIVSSSTSTTTNATGTTINTNCSTIEVNNGQQVVLCSGLEKTPLTLNICTAANTCTNFPVQLQACPATQGSTAAPGTNKTQTAPQPGNGTVSVTPSPGVGVTTATPLIINTPTP